MKASIVSNLSKFLFIAPNSEIDENANFLVENTNFQHFSPLTMRCYDVTLVSVRKYKISILPPFCYAMLWRNPIFSNIVKISKKILSLLF